MAPTWFKLLLVVLLIVVLFGRGRISDVMGDFAKGIKNFKKGMSDDGDAAGAPKPVEADPAAKLEPPLIRGDEIRAG
jgi:sec-independent protein translocase protein TatA